jgi:hypothetical protein
MFSGTHSKKLCPSYVSWINHKNSEPLVSVSKLLLPCLFSTLLGSASQLRGTKDDKLGRKPKLSRERLGSATVCSVAEDTKVTKGNENMLYIAARMTGKSRFYLTVIESRKRMVVH